MRQSKLVRREGEKMTRYERIISMSIEEMAEKIISLGIVADEYCKGDCESAKTLYVDRCMPGPEKECCIRWLKEEAE